jgi:hypothetical protein
VDWVSEGIMAHNIKAVHDNDQRFKLVIVKAGEALGYGPEWVVSEDIGVGKIHETSAKVSAVLGKAKDDVARWNAANKHIIDTGCIDPECEGECPATRGSR